MPVLQMFIPYNQRMRIAGTLALFLMNLSI